MDLLFKELYQINEIFLKGWAYREEGFENLFEVCIQHGNHIYVIADETSVADGMAHEYVIEVTACDTLSHELTDIQNSDKKLIGCFRYNPIDAGESNSWVNYITYKAEAELIRNCIKNAEENNEDAQGSVIWKLR